MSNNINITVIYGTGNSAPFNAPVGTTLDAVLTNSTLRATLGFGQNVEGHIDSVPQARHVRLADGDRVYIYDTQCKKAAETGITRVTVVYGTGNSFTKDFTHPVTVGQVLADSALRGRLGFGENVEGHLGGVPMTKDRTLFTGDTLYVYDVQCKKAV